MSGPALSFMHVGALVSNLDTAIAEYSSLGTSPWATSDELLFATYDGERGAIVEQHVRIAYGRIPGNSAIELIEPLPSSPDSPQRRLFDATPGVTHYAYWCRDLPATLQDMLDDGAQLFTAAVPDRVSWAALLEAEGERGLVPLIDACYVRIPTGAIIELVAASMIEGPLQRMLGANIADILPVPDFT